MDREADLASSVHLRVSQRDEIRLERDETSIDESVNQTRFACYGYSMESNRCATIPCGSCRRAGVARSRGRWPGR